MKLLKTIPAIVFVALNLAVAAAMIFCAHTAYLPPQDYSQLSYFGLMFPVFLVADACFVVFWLIFKWRLAAIPLVGMLLCGRSVWCYAPLNIETERPEGCIKVLSYNVMGFGDDKTVPWPDSPILNYMLNSGADVICVQEAWRTHMEEALDLMRERYPYISVNQDLDNFIMCFSKFPIGEVRQIEYPSVCSNCSYVYDLIVGSDTVLLINNHLESYRLSKEDKDDYKSIIENYNHPESNDSETKYIGLTEKLSRCDSVRGMQADSVAAFVERNRGRSIIACGDFNASPISYPHHRLARVLNDAYTRSGNGPGTSYNRSGMYFRLDHIFVSADLEAFSATVDRSIKESDHYPIYCYVKLGQK